jgi:hypothetical protein
MFKSLLKATVAVVTTPVDVVADVVTMGGAMTDQDKPYTAQKLEKVMENLSDAVDPDKD